MFLESVLHASIRNGHRPSLLPYNARVGRGSGKPAACRKRRPAPSIPATPIRCGAARRPARGKRSHRTEPVPCRASEHVPGASARTSLTDRAAALVGPAPGGADACWMKG